MEKERQSKKLLFSFKSYSLIPMMVLTEIIALSILFITLYAYTHIGIFVLVFDIIAIGSLAAYIVFYIRLSKKLKITYYNQLFETTYTNINKIKNNDINLVSYGDSDIKEIQMLEKATSDIKAKLDSSYLLLKTPDYSNIKLDYVDKELGLITYKSFSDNIANIIFVSQSFRNVIIEVFFDLPSGLKIVKKDKTRLLNLCKCVNK